MLVGSSRSRMMSTARPRISLGIPTLALGLNAIPHDANLIVRVSVPVPVRTNHSVWFLTIEEKLQDWIEFQSHASESDNDAMVTKPYWDQNQLEGWQMPPPVPPSDPLEPLSVQHSIFWIETRLSVYFWTRKNAGKPPKPTCLTKILTLSRFCTVRGDGMYPNQEVSFYFRNNRGNFSNIFDGPLVPWLNNSNIIPFIILGNSRWGSKHRECG